MALLLILLTSLLKLFLPFNALFAVFSTLLLQFLFYFSYCFIFVHLREELEFREILRNLFQLELKVGYLYCQLYFLFITGATGDELEFIVRRDSKNSLQIWGEGKMRSGKKMQQLLNTSKFFLLFMFADCGGAVLLLG